MQNEKQNKEIRQKIDELQQLPVGFALNSAKVWAGLEQQLPLKKNTLRWHYAAAAVLLVMGSVYLAFLVTHSNTVVIDQATATVPAAHVKDPVPIPPTGQKNKEQVKPVLRSLEVSEKNTFAIRVKQTKEEEKKPVDIEIDAPSKTIIPVEQTAIVTPPIEQVNKEKEIKKTSPAIATVKPAPKKYKVVHLNELMQSPAMPDGQNILSRSELKKMMQQQNEEKEILLPAENAGKQLFFFKIKPVTPANTISIVEN